MTRRVRHTVVLVYFGAVASALLFAQHSGGNAHGAAYGSRQTSVVYGSAPPPVPTSLPVSNLSMKEETRPLKFRSQSRLVLVPVAITDKNGRHVPGLGKTDFTVYENGSEQKIAFFEEVTSKSGALRSVAMPQGQFTNQLAGAETAIPINIIVLDLINTPFLDQQRAREELIKFLPDFVDAARPTALVVAREKGVATVYPLTSDPGALIAALKKVPGQPHALQGYQDPATLTAELTAAQASGDLPGEVALWMMEQQQQQYKQDIAVQATLQAFQDIAQSFGGLPGRKSMIWITDGFPIDIDPSGDNILLRDTSAVLFQRAVQMLGDANVAVYPVDVRGLVGTASVSAETGFRSASVAGGAPIRAAISAQQSLNTATIDSLKYIANATGGRAFYNRNDIGQEVKDAANQGASYYLLSYYLDKNNTTPGWRKLKVKLDRDNVTIRARSGFMATRVTTDPLLTRDSDLYLALHSPMSYTGMPLTVTMQLAPSKAAQRKVLFELNIPSGAVSVDETDSNRLKLDIAALSIDTVGKEAARFQQALDIKPNADHLREIQTSGITYRQSLELAPGNYSVRFVVRDSLTGKMGSVVAPITVN
jgi:VWFA-related protein